MFDDSDKFYYVIILVDLGLNEWELWRLGFLNLITWVEIHVSKLVKNVKLSYLKF